MIDLVRGVAERIAAAHGVDHVQITLYDGPTRAELDAALGEPAPVPRMPGAGVDRLAYPAPGGVSVFADIDDDTGRVVSVLIRRDTR